MKKTEAPEVIDINKYISKKALDSLGAAEGHWKGVEGPKTSREKKKKVFTTFYGITKDGLASLKEFKKDFNVVIPERLLKHTMKTLTQEDAREIAGYIAAYNTKILDRDSNSGSAFSELDPYLKDAILVLQHTGGTRNLKNSYKNPAAVGSLMKAIDTKDRDKIARAIISKSDGTYMPNPIWSDPDKVGTPDKEGKDGRYNRHYLAIKMIYDPSFVLTPENKDTYYGKWRREKTTDKIVRCLDSIDSAKGKVFEQQQQICQMTTVFENLPLKTEDKTQQVQKQEPSKEMVSVPKEEASFLDKFKEFFTNFTFGDKKMQTNENEVNNGTGNENNNLQ